MTIILTDKETLAKLNKKASKNKKEKVPYLTKKEAAAWGKLLGTEAKGWGSTCAKVAGEFLSTKLL